VLVETSPLEKVEYLSIVDTDGTLHFGAQHLDGRRRRRHLETLGILALRHYYCHLLGPENDEPCSPPCSTASSHFIFFPFPSTRNVFLLFSSFFFHEFLARVVVVGSSLSGSILSSGGFDVLFQHQ
jgi:hypothetical protein